MQTPNDSTAQTTPPAQPQATRTGYVTTWSAGGVITAILIVLIVLLLTPAVFQKLAGICLQRGFLGCRISLSTEMAIFGTILYWLLGACIATIVLIGARKRKVVMADNASSGHAVVSDHAVVSGHPVDSDRLVGTVNFFYTGSGQGVIRSAGKGTHHFTADNVESAGPLKRGDAVSFVSQLHPAGYRVATAIRAG